jgi:hypothetical protein
VAVPATQLRLPGIYFLPAAPPAAPLLPPLDVAAFVGFAERGPLHLPVAVEDPAVYDAIFGGDVPLAQESREGGRTVYANLPPAVRTFFAQGGRRCYVVRVAGAAARAAAFRAPGLVAVAATGEAVVPTLAAAWPGAWANQMRLATRLRATPLPVEAFTVAGPASLRWQTGSAPDALDVGDVLRLTADDGSAWLFPVTTVDRSPIVTGAATLVADRVWPLVVGGLGSPPPSVLQAARLTADAPLALPLGGVVASGAGGLILHPAPNGPAVSAGEVLRLELSDGGTYLFPVEAVGGAAGDLTAGGMLRLDAGADLVQVAGSPPLAFERIERLRFDVLPRLGDALRPPIAEVAFNAGHPRFWGDAVHLESTMLRGQAVSDTVVQQQQLPAAQPGGAGRAPETAAAHAARLYRELQSDLRSEPARDGVPNPAALAALLAPHAPDDGGSGARTFLPLGMALFATDDRFVGPASEAQGSDDLGRFDAHSAALFLDPYLASGVGGSTPAALLANAFDRYYVQNRRLRGLHSLLFVDEVALVAMPEAVHPNWARGVAAATGFVSPAAPATPPAVCPPGAFADCQAAPLVLAVAPADGPTDRSTLVTIYGSGFQGGPPLTVTFGDLPATDVQVLSATRLTCRTPVPSPAGPVDVSVTTGSGSSRLANAFVYWQPATAPTLSLVMDAEYRLDESPLLTLHRALLTFCEARADVLGILTLPRQFEKRQCIDWLQALRAELGLPQRGGARDDARDVADLSYVAVYHPWLLVRDPDAPDRLRPVPPDGAVCGMIAAREHARQVWVAPANLPLTPALGLVPPISDDDWADLFALQFNLVRPEPRDFRVMSAHTLADERSLLQVSVRRLLILLRKTALERGMDFVFESNHERFREGVRVALENLLRFMFERGAFAGATPAEAYRVITDASVNTPQSVDQGRFIALIQVAPSQPLEFVTVLLTRTDPGTLLTVEG